MLDHFEPSQIEDETLRQQFIVLVNLLEKALSENSLLKDENATLKDEITKLKGGQGRPPFGSSKAKAKSNDPLAQFKQPKPPSAASSHAAKAPSRKAAKNAKLTPDRVETLELEWATLPKDAQFKGYQEVVVQDVKFEATTILFRRAKYYSPAQTMAYTAALPSGYNAERS